MPSFMALCIDCYCFFTVLHYHSIIFLIEIAFMLIMPLTKLEIAFTF